MARDAALNQGRAVGERKGVFNECAIAVTIHSLQGNAAFKGGDYLTAIGHYTTALATDNTDPTYPLNRAAAYLKLGEYVYLLVYIPVSASK
jgi:Flp pilus assembly protein TadD